MKNYKELIAYKKYEAGKEGEVNRAESDVFYAVRRMEDYATQDLPIFDRSFSFGLQDRDAEKQREIREVYIKDLKAALVDAGVNGFYYTNTSTAVMSDIHFFVSAGFEMETATLIRNWFEKEEVEGLKFSF